MENIDPVEVDKKRVSAYYKNKTIYSRIPGSVGGWLDYHNIFLENITDLSEEFHREFSQYYNLSHWYKMFRNQTKLSEQFYDDFFHKIDYESLAVIIRSGRVSNKWVEKNLYKISDEVWEKVYA